jgi:hypothetical protein
MVAADTAAGSKFRSAWIVEQRFSPPTQPICHQNFPRFPLPNRFMQDIAIQFQRLPNKPTKEKRAHVKENIHFFRAPTHFAFHPTGDWLE